MCVYVYVWMHVHACIHTTASRTRTAYKTQPQWPPPRALNDQPSICEKLRPHSWNLLAILIKSAFVRRGGAGPDCGGGAVMNRLFLCPARKTEGGGGGGARKSHSTAPSRARPHARTPVRSRLPFCRLLRSDIGLRRRSAWRMPSAVHRLVVLCSLFFGRVFFLCRSLFICCWLYVFDCSLFAVYCLLFVVRCPILIIRCTLYLFSVLWSLLIVDFIVIHFSLFNEFIVQFTHCSLFVNHFSLFFVCCLLFTVRCLQFLMHGNEHQSQRENNEDYLRRRTMQPHTRV